MSRYQYFDELSVDDRSCGSCSDTGSENDVTENGDRIVDKKDDALSHQENDISSNDDHQEYRMILHADVDCFYCQCEVLDRQLDPSRPIAIGQKHIIVTCNYAARSFGITKLMDRKLAQQILPSLLIIDGSDLQRYRIHGRKIYDSFRRAIKGIDSNSKVRKGCMDEMSADVSSVPAFDTVIESSIIKPDDVFIYNDPNNKDKSVITLTEDQTGAQTMIYPSNNTTPGATVERPVTKNENLSITAFTKRLHDSLILAKQVRQAIFAETGFTTTMGISYNPMMSKIASGLRKPGIINVILPGSSSQLLIENMPLRKIPTIGSRTMKALLPALEQCHGCKDTTNTDQPALPWICSDLLQVPRNEIIRCLNNVRTGDLSSSDQCTTILNLCRGHDSSKIIDDEGTLQKSLSVENSLRNGTIRTKEQVLIVMEDLYRRLPLLIQDRMEWSDRPSLAYPTTLRISVRSSFDKIGHGRKNRKFITRSIQCKFDGQALCNKLLNTSDATIFLRRSVTPLLQSLLFNSGDINVTRLNICVSNFQDIDAVSAKGPTAAQRRLTAFVAPKRTTSNR